MRLLPFFLLHATLVLPAQREPDPATEVRETVEHFLDLLGRGRYDALGRYLAADANVITARATTSGYVNEVVSARSWNESLLRGPAIRPFREALANVDVAIERGELAVVRAEFEIQRDGRADASGVDVFTLVRRDGAWKIAAIAYTSIPSAVEPDALLGRIEAALDALPAKSSLYAKHLPTGREIAVRADVPMNTLSVIKLPVMVLAYRDAEAGRLDLDARYKVLPEDLRRGSGLLQSFAPGLEPTYRDVVTQMIVTSDNTATDIMIERLGLDRVNALLSERGYTQTRLNATTGLLFRRVWEQLDPAYASLTPAEVFAKGFPEDPEASARSFVFEGESAEWLGRSTARETARLLEEIHEAKLASRISSDEMLDILRRQFYDSRLPRFLPNVEIAHKTGDWPPIAGNDVGILFHPGGPTIVAVYVNQNRGDFDEVEKTIGEIARWLVQAWGS